MTNEYKPTRLWQAIERWYRYNPIVLMYVASRAVYSKGSIAWLDRADRTTLGNHCSRFESCNEAWAAIPIDERRGILRTAQLSQSLAGSSWDNVALAFAALVEQDRARDSPVAFSVEVAMVVPDELLAWADGEQLAWPRPWATEARELLSGQEPLDADATSRLLNRLDAITAAAVRSRRFDLCAGFDTLTAELLGLSYSFEAGEKKVTIGSDGQWSYHELELVLETGSQSAASLSIKAKDLVSDVFPQMRIESVTLCEEDPVCSACQSPMGMVSMQMASGSWVCASCWQIMTRPPKRKQEMPVDDGDQKPRQGVIQGTRGR